MIHARAATLSLLENTRTSPGITNRNAANANRTQSTFVTTAMRSHCVMCCTPSLKSSQAAPGSIPEHQAGDAVLQRFVQKCLDAIRPYDGVARIGGEEFMVLLPQAALETAHSIGERLRAAIAGSPFEAGIGRPIEVTVSVGISEFGRDGETIDAMLRKADERLYRAKHQGRNRVVAT